MMTNQPTSSKPAGSIKTVWSLRTYDVWGNAKDGFEVNDTYSAGTVELRIPQTRFNIGVEWHVCRNPKCSHNGRGVLPIGTRELNLSYERTAELARTTINPHCEFCKAPIAMESQEFVSAFPTDRQIKRAFGVRCRIEVDGDDISVYVTRQRDGYPIVYCESHESLSPVRAKGEKS